jgi:predicted nucleotidyltransferase
VIPAEMRSQLGEVLAGLRSELGGDLVGVYLHGSVVLGCFGPHSDIDVMAVSVRKLGRDRKHALVQMLLEVSNAPRPVELDVILASTLRRWRHPAPFEFHYSESLRGRFEAGELEPWEHGVNRDLAAHAAVIREAGVAVVGPPPSEVFPEIPEADFCDALRYDVEWWRGHLAELEEIPGGVRNAVLSLARIWATLSTGDQHSKATGVEWTLPQLPAELRLVLEHAYAVYLGTAEERWSDLPVADYVSAVAGEIDVLTQR